MEKEEWQNGRTAGSNWGNGSLAFRLVHVCKYSCGYTGAATDGDGDGGDDAVKGMCP